MDMYILILFWRYVILFYRNKIIEGKFFHSDVGAAYINYKQGYTKKIEYLPYDVFLLKIT